MIFISYRISDSLDMVDRLDADLTREFGPDAVFRDKSRLHGGHDWTHELENNAKTRPVMLVVIGATWQSTTCPEDDWKGVPRLWHPDDWVRKEITLALDAGKLVIPVFLNNATMPAEGWVANCKLERLYKKQGERLRSTDYHNDVNKLIEVLRKQCPKLPAKPAGDPPTAAGERLSLSGQHTVAYWSGQHTVAYWNEEGEDRFALLRRVIARLDELGWGSGWCNWDLRIYCNRWTLVEVGTTQEDHGWPKRLIRIRIRLRLREQAKALAWLGLLAAGGAALYSLPLAAGIAAAVPVGLLAIWRCGVRKVARAVAVFDDAAREGKWVRCSPRVG